MYLDFHVIDKRDVNLDPFFDGLIGLDNIKEMNLSPLSSTIELKNASSSIELQNFPRENVTKTFSIDAFSKDAIEKRHEFLNKTIITDHLEEEDKQEVLNLCKFYNNIFFLPNDKLNATNLLQHRIDLEDEKPVRIKQFPIKPCLRDELDNQLIKLINSDIIEEDFHSSWNLPIFLVPKPNKTYRLVIDARELNKKVKAKYFEIPTVDHILLNLSQMKYFTKIDLKDAFYQISVEEESRKYLCFSCISSRVGSRFRFRRLPPGLVDATATMQRIAEIAFRGLINVCLFIYVDDVICYGKTKNDCLKSVSACFERLAHAGLKITPEKTIIMKQNISFLGHHLGPKGISPGPKKLDLISKLSTPTTKKALKSNISLMNYFRKFIPNFAGTSLCLYELVNSKSKFLWTKKHHEAYEKLKKDFSEVKSLSFPDFTKPLIITCDASQFAISGVLSQFDDDKQEVILSFCSRKLHAVETRYSSYEREMLSLIYALTNAFKHFTLNRTTIIRTDHKALIYLLQSRIDANCDRIIRYRLRLNEYRYRVIYQAGKSSNHFLADLVSRIDFSENGNENVIMTENLPEDIQVYVVTRSKQKQIENESLSLDFNNFQKDLNNRKSLKKVSFISESFEVIDIAKPRVVKIFLTAINQNFPDAYLTEIREIIGGDLKLNEMIYKQNVLIYPYKQAQDEIITEERLFQILYEIRSKLRSLQNHFELHFANIPKLFLPFSTFHAILAYLFRNDSIKIKIFRDKAIKIDSMEKKQELIKNFHESLIDGGHRGQKSILRKIKKLYDWKGIRNDVAKFIQSCHLCNLNKRKLSPPLPLKVISSSDDTFVKFYCDIIGSFALSPENYKYAFTAIDDLSRFLISFPLKHATSTEIADGLMKHVILAIGVPLIIIFDNAHNLNSETMKDLMKILKIKKINCSISHPQSNLVEAHHALIKTFIKNYISDENNWPELLPYAVFSHNNNFSETIQAAPNEIIYGKILRTPADLDYNKIPTTSDYIINLKSKLNLMKLKALENIHISRANNKKFFDKKHHPKTLEINAGDLVYVKAAPKSQKAFKNVFSGPFEVVQPFEHYCKILVGRMIKTFHKNKLKLYKENEEQRDENEIESDIEIEEPTQQSQ